MSDAELLIKEIKTLSSNRVAEVLDFVEFIKQKDIRNTESNNDSWFEKGEECPICAKHRDPKTGELRFNAETMAGIQEVEDMISGKIPNTLKKFNSLEEMLADLDSDD